MTTTDRPLRPDPTRTGAVWVTGTGAFLLLAAAAVFTAVRWDQIPAGAKLAALGLATGGFLLAGRRLHPTLPATAGALFHVGAFLVPIDVAALGLRADVSGPALLLLEGLAATATFGWAARTEDSVVLRWSAGAAVVVLAGGIGATTAFPPALLLLAAAGTATRRGRDTLALAWAATVALVPVVAIAERLAVTGTTVTGWLRLAPGHQPLAAATAALGAAAVIGLVARRRDQADLALVGIVLGAAGATASWAGTHPSAGQIAVSLAAAFLGLEAAAVALRGDAFWRVPAAVLAEVGERLAWIGMVLVAVRASSIAGVGPTDPTLTTTALLGGAGWAIADRRRGAIGLRLATSAAAVCAIAAVVGVHAGLLPLAVTLTLVALGAVLAGRSDGPVVAALTATAAPLVAFGSPAVAGLVGVTGAFVIAEAAVRRSHGAAERTAGRRDLEDASQGLGLAALLPLAAGGWAVAHDSGATAAVLASGVIAIAVLAAWLDRGADIRQLPLGTPVRAAAVALLLGTDGLPAWQVVLVAGTIAIVSAADAVRLDTPLVALGASVATPVALAAFVRSTACRCRRPEWPSPWAGWCWRASAHYSGRAGPRRSAPRSASR